MCIHDHLGHGLDLEILSFAVQHAAKAKAPQYSPLQSALEAYRDRFGQTGYIEADRTEFAREVFAVARLDDLLDSNATAAYFLSTLLLFGPLECAAQPGRYSSAIEEITKDGVYTEAELSLIITAVLLRRNHLASLREGDVEDELTDLSCALVLLYNKNMSQIDLVADVAQGQHEGVVSDWSFILPEWGYLLRTRLKHSVTALTRLVSFTKQRGES